MNNDVKFWQAFTKEETKCYGTAVYCSLKRQAREDARRIFINDLKKDDGVEEIIRILDKIPERDEVIQACHAFKEYVE